MTWINWAYLGVGVGLGILIKRIEQHSQDIMITTSRKSDHDNHKLDLQQQIQKTQMAYEMAREMSYFKSGFLARTTHVLRSPLNGLIGLHQLILSDLCDSSEEERKFLSQANERALKLLKLIDEILLIAKMEHGTNELNISSVSLAELLKNVHQIIYMLAENRNYPLQVRIPDADIYVLADVYWLRQVLVNLLSLAILNMEEGSISVSSNNNTENNIVHIYLDVPQATIPESEAIDYLNPDVFNRDQENHVSPGMRLLMNQTILELMGGKLEIVPYPILEEAGKFTRLQVSIPQGLVSTASPQPSERMN
ncbi:Histidine Kinase [Richelia intracellularis HH01]|uniref:histidine kinase n=1 Tax=Richelia intracellularis HH01 TaxID=1165094 RepID=M1WS05_9NOST|nr:HAMP domain-containing sensor histidine kinase [Richelia intracellularis]CCH67179.1 Histidine Kinase [Richelia intracellularis HH01]